MTPVPDGIKIKDCDYCWNYYFCEKEYCIDDAGNPKDNEPGDQGRSDPGGPALRTSVRKV